MGQTAGERLELAFSNRAVKRLTRRILLAAGLTASTVGGYGTDGDMLAQDGSPVPVSPANCTVAARSPEDLTALLKAPPGVMRSDMNGTPVVTPTMPEGGSPADAATVDLVTATAREAVACLNAGDFARLFSLYSDHYLREVWGGVDGPDLSDDAITARVQSLASPVPQSEDQQLALVAVEDVRVLPDGLVVATMINDRGRSRTSFVKVGEHYLIDWAFPLPAEGTPTPR